MKQAENEPSKLEQLEEADLEILKKRGYLTEMSEEEELEAIRKISEILNQICCDSLLITIMPTYNCNFRCEYCFEQNLLEKGKEWLSGKMTTEMVDAIFEQLQKYKKDGKRVMGVYLFGGEKYGVIDPNRFQFNSIYQGLFRSLKNMIQNNTIAPLRSGYCGAHTGMYTIAPYGGIWKHLFRNLKKETKCFALEKLV